MVKRTDRPVERPKPSLRVDDTDLPAIKNWQVGKKYKVTMHVKMVHHAQGEEYGMDGQNSKKHSARLEVHQIEPQDDEDGK